MSWIPKRRITKDVWGRKKRDARPRPVVSGAVIGKQAVGAGATAAAAGQDEALSP